MRDVRKSAFIRGRPDVTDRTTDAERGPRASKARTTTRNTGDTLHATLEATVPVCLELRASCD